jgi:hypothetical protein
MKSIQLQRLLEKLLHVPPWPTPSPHLWTFSKASHRAISQPIQNSELLIKSWSNLALFISRLKFPEENVELDIWLMGREADIEVTRKNYSVAGLPLTLS